MKSSLVLPTLLALAASGLLPAAPGHASLTQVEAELVTGGLASPLFATAPDGDPRLFVVLRAGRIVVLENGVIGFPDFLDISDRVSTDNERGLLGLAFDPDYASNGHFYVYYSDLAGDSVVSRFRVSDDPYQAEPEESILLTIPQPFANHNGGTVAFGRDGFLYLGPGDGGSSNDPGERSQDPAELLGKILRIDVGVPAAPGSMPSPDGDYAIPDDNPFVGDPGTRDEIWAFGLRNPYRFSFDRRTGDLWIADVGQDRREEVNFEPAGHPGGRNYGWDVEEGSICNPSDPAPAPACGDPSLVRPVHEYAHGGDECSITGGFVHRGDVPAIGGHYLFGDFCSGRIFSLHPATGETTERTGELGPAGGRAFSLVGFGEDGVGGSYVVLSSGEIYRVMAAPAECGDGIDNDGDGQVDTDDPGCLHNGWPEEDPACDNGQDDDGDGQADLDDPDCRRRWNISEATMSCGLLGGEALALLLAARAILLYRPRRPTRTQGRPSGRARLRERR